MDTPENTLPYSLFSRWLTLGLGLYLAGFYLAPSSEAQYLTLYIGMILPALYFSCCHFQRYYLAGNRALLWVLLAVLALYIPSLWADTESLLHTLRRNLKAVLFVLSFAVAMRHLALHYPQLLRRLPDWLVLCCAIALALFYVRLAMEGVAPRGVQGMGNLGDNPNETGLALASGLVLALFRYNQDRNPLWWLLILPLVPAIYLAYSRAALLGLVVVIPFAMLFHHGWKQAALGYLFFCTMAAGITIAILAQGSLDADQLLSNRPTLWQAFLDNKPHFHWLWGAGLHDNIAITPESLGRKLEPHSLFFALVLRGGILALMCFFALLVIAFNTLRTKASSSRCIWAYLLLFGLVTQFFEGVYPVRPPNSFWLYTWLPILALILSPNSTGPITRK